MNDPDTSTESGADTPEKERKERAVSFSDTPPASGGRENGKKEEKEEKETGSTFDPTRLPPEVYDHLPKTLARPANCLDGHERDTFLTGALPVCAGAMPNVRLRYGGQWLSLNHYMAVIAPPGSGKGKLRLAKQLGEKLDEELYEESRREIERWKSQMEDEDAGSRPQERALFLPGDSSAAELKHMLQANNNAVMFETEFSTVGAVLDQDWGQFRDVLLKSYHNEPVSVARRGEDLLRIGHPAVSLALSGTPATFREIVGDVEDGLFSRFSFYMFDGEPEWEPQFADETDWELDEHTTEAADRLNGIHDTLSQRDEPLYVIFPEEVREAHTAACGAALEGLKTSDVDPALYPSVKRTGLDALRFGAIFALLRLDERAVDLSAPKSVALSEGDLCAGLYLAFAYLSHALRVADYLKMSDGAKGLHEDQRAYLSALPDGAFDTEDANRIAEKLGIYERKARMWRKKYVEKGLLVDAGYGEWRKPTAETPPGVLSVHAVLSAFFDGELNHRPAVEEADAPF